MQILQADRDALLRPAPGRHRYRRAPPYPADLASVLIEKAGDTLTFLATDLEIQSAHASRSRLPDRTSA